MVIVKIFNQIVWNLTITILSYQYILVNKTSFTFYFIEEVVEQEGHPLVMAVEA